MQGPYNKVTWCTLAAILKNQLSHKKYFYTAKHSQHYHDQIYKLILLIFPINLSLCPAMRLVLTKLEPASPLTKAPAQYTKVAAILKILTLRPIDLTQSSLFDKTTQWIALKRRYLVDNTLINKSLPSRCNQACMNTVMLSATPTDRSDLSSVWQLSQARSTRRSQTTADAWARTGSWYQCRRRPNSGYWTRRIPADRNHRRYTTGTYFDSS